MSQTLAKFFRKWHRDLGYFVIALTILYSFSGITLAVRDLGLFQSTYEVSTKIQAQLNVKQIPSIVKQTFTQSFMNEKVPDYLLERIKFKRFKLLNNTNQVVEFMVNKRKYRQSISYDKNTGKLTFYLKAYSPILAKIVNAHKSDSSDIWTYLALIYSIILLFLAVSAFFMVQGKYGFKNRGMYISFAGLVIVLIFLFI